MKATVFRVELAVVSMLFFTAARLAAQGTSQPKTPVVKETAPNQWATRP